MPFRPMLAAQLDPDRLRFPLLGSPKIDGIRAVVRDGIVLSRSLKPIPNRFVQECFGHLEGMDGELYCDTPNAPNVMQATMSACMTQEGEPNVRFAVFDTFREPQRAFRIRHLEVQEKLDPPGVAHPLGQTVIRNTEELHAFLDECLALGYEGAILRDPLAPYKQGRSTVREGGMLKLKPFTDSEAYILGFTEALENLNELTLDERGYAKRSSHQEGKVGKGVLGALIVRDLSAPESEPPFLIGTGFTTSQREELWERREELYGLIVKYKFLNHGIVSAPRHPVFLGFRSRLDL